MNALIGERLSIITSKAQTTRHRIMGIVSGENYQIVFSDTPGILKPNYKLQEKMMQFVISALSDADVCLLITDVFEDIELQPEFFEKMFGGCFELHPEPGEKHAHKQYPGDAE